MNSHDSPQNTAILNRLILLVLTLILICLVLLVFRAYTRLAGDARVEVVEPPVTEEAPVPVVVQQVTPGRPRPVAQPQAVAAPVEQKTEPEETPPTFLLPYERPNPGSVAIPGLGGVGVPVITAASEAAKRMPPSLEDSEIFGLATLLGTPKPETILDLGPACGRLNPGRVTTRHYVVNSEGGLANVFVYLSDVHGRKYSPPETPVVLDQVGCMFEPYILGVETGQPLTIRNSDPEMHNIHLTPRVNEEFNFAQLKGQVNTKRISRHELFMRVKCDVHPWMFAYVSAVWHPFFAVTDTNGVFRLPKGLRAGRYTLMAAHLKAGTLSQEVDFKPGKPQAVQFQFVVPATTQVQNEGSGAIRKTNSRRQ